MSKRLTKLLRDAQTDLDFRAKRKQFQVSLAIRQRLHDRKITQAALAQKLGVSEAAVSKLLRGTENHTIAKLVEVSDALGLDVNIVFDEKRRDRKTEAAPAQHWETFTQVIRAVFEPSEFDLARFGVASREWKPLERPVDVASSQDAFDAKEPAAA